MQLSQKTFIIYIFFNVVENLKIIQVPKSIKHKRVGCNLETVITFMVLEYLDSCKKNEGLELFSSYEMKTVFPKVLL